MNTPQEFEKITSKMVLKFLWRHLLTVASVLVLVAGIHTGNEGLILGTAFWMFFALAIDSAKCNRDFWRTPRERSNFDQYNYSNEQWNPHRIGTTAYFIDQAGKRY